MLWWGDGNAEAETPLDVVVPLPASPLLTSASQVLAMSAAEFDSTRALRWRVVQAFAPHLHDTHFSQPRNDDASDYDLTSVLVTAPPASMVLDVQDGTVAVLVTAAASFRNAGFGVVLPFSVQDVPLAVAAHTFVFTREVPLHSSGIDAALPYSSYQAGGHVDGILHDTTRSFVPWTCSEGAVAAVPGPCTWAHYKRSAGDAPVDLGF